jgi:hypothetical protein
VKPRCGTNVLSVLQLRWVKMGSWPQVKCPSLLELSLSFMDAFVSVHYSIPPTSNDQRVSKGRNSSSRRAKKPHGQIKIAQATIGYRGTTIVNTRQLGRTLTEIGLRVQRICHFIRSGMSPPFKARLNFRR